MSLKLYEETDIQSIANSIRGKNGTTNTYKVSEMSSAIDAIGTGSGGITPTGTIDITENGTHDVTNYATANVNVSSEWQPPSDWWDIDSILENDTEDYAGKMIALLSDIYDITSIATRGANKIVTSDGNVYTPTSEDNISHSWDKIKDKDCSLGYKTRYIIWYYNESSDNNLSKSFSSNEGKIVLSVILKNFSNLNIGGDSWTDTNINLFNGSTLLESIIFDNCTLKIVKYFICNNCNNLQQLKGPIINQDIINSKMQWMATQSRFKVFPELFKNLVHGSQGWNLYELKTIPNYQKYGDGAGLGYGCNLLEKVDIENYKPKSFVNFCYGARCLKKIKSMDFINASSVDWRTLNGCTSLIQIDEVSNLKVSGLNLSGLELLNHDTLIRILNALYDYAAEGSTDTYTLIVGTKNLAKLSDEEKAIATNKGWTLAKG